MYEIRPIQALHDNYIWMIVQPDLAQAIVIDPGDAEPVIHTLTDAGLSLAAILITHHHWDHTNGIAPLKEHYQAPVYAPANDSVALCDYPLADGDTVTLSELGWQFDVIEIPGHTLGHIAYIGLGAAFTGDTLFTGGCGRVFEGTPQQMLISLQRLSALTQDTLVYCGHEYTTENLQFALLVEPNNKYLVERQTETQRLRAQQLPTVPSTLELELQTNPFLRCTEASIQAAAEQYAGHALNSPAEVFVTIREWKNSL